ncbi:hypothetical protein [Thermomicrobium sp.]|uniref:hypothetical protein n=1 Tax=Thermomicrobium sp. TaxID=1969469 RepID=UPI001B081D56|nr:hypothetical protein [Thermomicrobium sp.]MBO9307867.1 hypothetical protein [Thermomicrobium sp.]MBO9352010.1 hypothetical protein [Thermomicrobium sp.]MBO9360378.1 hypothetical protein [Thermomicrobium sp.]
MERVVEHQDRTQGERRGDRAIGRVASAPACSANSLPLFPVRHSPAERGTSALVRQGRCLATHGAQPDKRGTKRSA